MKSGPVTTGKGENLIEDRHRSVPSKHKVLIESNKLTPAFCLALSRDRDLSLPRSFLPLAM